MATMGTVLAGFQERQAVLEASSSPYSKGIAWVQGELTPLHEARIPLIDQGFLHGDLTYDVPAVWDSRIFRFDEHLDRLELSCTKMRMKLPRSKEEIKEIVYDMTRKSAIRDAYVEIIVTRGLQFVRRAESDTPPMHQNLYILVQPYVWVMPLEFQPYGASAIITRTVRRIPPGAIDPTIKNLQWGDLIRGIFEAQDRESHYPFLTDGDGNITEGCGYNIFTVKDGTLYTPSRGVLEGVTRRTVCEIAEAKGFPVRVEHVSVESALKADEIFMCTTAGGIMPIVELEGSVVGEGCPGPITLAVWDEYWALHYDPKYSVAIDYEQNVQETPVAQQKLEAQRLQEIQQAQETPVVKQEPEAQELQKVQEVHEAPVVQQEPEAQEPQKIQEVQQAPAVQQEPEAQELQEIQQVQEVPSSDIPVRPVPITKISSPELSVTPVTTEA